MSDQPMNLLKPALLTTSFPILLFSIRLFSFLLLLVYIYLTIEYDQYNYIKFFSFYTNWGMIATFLYYSSVLALYKFYSLDRLSSIILQTAWTIQGIVSLMFWAVLFKITTVATPMYLFVPRHGLFPLLMMIDILISDVRLARERIRVVICVSAIYLLGVNLPYTILIHPVYPYLNYQNMFSVLFIVGFWVVMHIWNEVGCYISKLGKSKRLDKLY